MTKLCQLEGRTLKWPILGRKLAISVTFFKISTSISSFFKCPSLKVIIFAAVRGLNS